MKSKVQCRCDFVLVIPCVHLMAINLVKIIENVQSDGCGNVDCKHSLQRQMAIAYSTQYRGVTNKRRVKFTGRLFLDKKPNSIHRFARKIEVFTSNAFDF